MAEEGEVLTKEKDGSNKPLISRTASGAAIVMLPLASVLGGLGWIGQKMLLIDETQKQHEIAIEADGARLEKLEALAAESQIVRATNARASEEMIKILDRLEQRQLDTIQRLSHGETSIEWVRKEQDRQRDKEVKGQ